MMKAFRTAGVVSVLMAFLAWSPAAHAAARVFVSVSGADSGDCSNVAAPCRTFNFAIAAVDDGGEVIVLTSGSYAGATVNKSVRINVPTGVVAFSASPITVNAGSVVIRGVTLKALTPGTGTGIVFNSGASLFVEECVLDGWAIGIDVEAAADVFVTGTTVRNINPHGMFVNAAARVAVEKSRFEAISNCSLDAVNGAVVAVRDSVFAGAATAGIGVCVVGAGSEVNVDSSLIANYTGAGGSGIQPFTGAIARVSHSIITGNALGLFNNGGTLESFGNNVVRGNIIDTFGTITTVALQ